MVVSSGRSCRDHFETFALLLLKRTTTHDVDADTQSHYNYNNATDQEHRPVGRVFVLGGRAIRAEGATFTAGGLGGAESPPTGPGQSPGGGPGGNPRKLCNFTVLRVID